MSVPLNYELTVQQRESEIIDWIWQPFNKESSDSSLPTIAGRIAYLLKEIPFVQRNRELLPDPRLVVPICAVESPINSLPDHIPATVEALLKQADGLTEANYIRASDNLLANISTSDQHWKQLLRTLPPILELDLLSRLIAQRQQHQHNYRRYWQDLFRPVDYELSTGWHYRSILTFAAVMTIIAISKVGFSIFTDPENPFFIASAVIVIYINLIFWVTLHQSDNKKLTPDLFWELGPKGIYTYTQCIQLYRKSLTWPFVGNLYRTISNRRVSFVVVITSGIAFIVRAISMFVVSHNTVAGAEFGIIGGILGGAFLMAGTVIVTAFIFAIVTISVALIVFVLISGAVAIAIAIKGGEDREKAMVGARLVNYAIESFLTGAGDASVIATASLATGIATGAIATAIDFEINFVIAIAGVIVGVGIGAWCQAKITPENLWLRFLVVLAFPYFCWFPLTSTFSTWAIYDSLAIISPLSLPLWQQTSTVLSVITGLCAVLWWRGKWLDTRAKNPFHGGALGKALGVNQ
ncbi:hypothetical protein Lepto7375DRAFT_7953 [Leptolyngbya sp. PCC 7375]|nr:hypothetical protein Lepto7375DRAFT_7953 [Leptolyngbya sp. PCC 7375]